MSHINRRNAKPGRCVLVLHCALLTVATLSLCGCDALSQMFNKTLLDPSQPIYLKPESVITTIRDSVSIYDEPLGNAPKDATDPLPEDLEPDRQAYRLVPGDIIEIRILELMGVGTETTLQREIRETGLIKLPQIPEIYLAGLSERQAELAIAEAYRNAGVLTNPQVSVTAVRRINRTFSVLGPFNTPGTFNILPGEFRVINALGMVGGLTNPTTEWLYVIRTTTPLQLPPRPGQGDGGPGPDNNGNGTPLPLPGGQPLRLPGGPSQPTANNNGGGNGATPGVGEDLRNWRPQGLPESPASPGERTNGVPATRPAVGGQGQWVLVDGKWSYLPPPTSTAGDQPGEPTGPQTRVIRISLSQLRMGDPRWNIVIRDKDVLVAPQPVVGEFYIVGNINRPGVYSLTDRRLTVTQAIAAAGWFGPLAVPSRVQLIRRISGDQQQTIVLNMADVIEGKAPDQIVKPYDVINIGTAVYAPFLAVLRNAFRATYGVGFVYDRNFADIDSYGPKPNPASR